MSWNIFATCDGCGRESGSHWNRSGLWRILRRRGWTKSSRARIYCPDCRAVAERENRKLGEILTGRKGHKDGAGQ